MGFDPASLGMQAAGTAVDTLMGLAMEGHNDRRQLRQQGKLLEQQAGIDRKQAQFQQQLGLETWRQTGPQALTAELKKAGLSPALQYGGAGGGGATTGGGSSGVNAEAAPRGGGEVMGLQMMNAQRQLIEAQTEKTKVETAKTAGVDTQLTAEQGRMATIMANLAATNTDEISDQLYLRGVQLRNEVRASKGMVNAELQRKQAEAIGAELVNEQRKVETNMTEAQMVALGEQIAQKWKELEIQEGKLDLERFIRDVKDSTRLTVETITKAVQLVGGGMIQKGLKEMPNKSEHTKKIEW